MKLMAMALLVVASSGAQAGESCEKAKADYARQVAEDAAVTNWGPGVKEANDKINRRMKANLLKGCEPGGFYDQLDEAIRQARATCTAQPNTKGC
jgi:hypothetical protein